jgi:hypothetical protein
MDLKAMTPTGKAKAARTTAKTPATRTAAAKKATASRTGSSPTADALLELRSEIRSLAERSGRLLARLG